MKLAFARAQLAQNGTAIEALATVDDEQARWKPAPDVWSILEVINHLVDEEREDFRQRVDYTLHRPEEPWPAIDPPGWVVSRSYNTRALDESLANFRAERENSLAWLRQLDGADWSATHIHPVAGPVTAGELLTAWLAHDGLHLRQLIELHRAYLRLVMPDGHVAYAGDW